MIGIVSPLGSAWPVRLPCNYPDRDSRSVVWIKSHCREIKIWPDGAFHLAGHYEQGFGAAYGMSWFDAHLWAYAEVYGLTEIIPEDFQHGRIFGSVMARAPFIEAG